MSGQQPEQPGIAVMRIPRQHLVCALAVEHDLDALRPSRFHHSPLGKDRGGAERLVLLADHDVESLQEIGRLERHAKMGNAGPARHQRSSFGLVVPVAWEGCRQGDARRSPMRAQPFADKLTGEGDDRR